MLDPLLTMSRAFLSSCPQELRWLASDRSKMGVFGYPPWHGSFAPPRGIFFAVIAGIFRRPAFLGTGESWVPK